MPYADPQRYLEYHRRYRLAHREQKRSYDHLYHLANRDKSLVLSHKYRATRKAWLDGVKRFLGCFVCGEDRPWRLLWHHLVPEEKVLSLGDGSRTNLNDTLAEMRRCVVLCANCHQDVHLDLRRKVATP